MNLEQLQQLLAMGPTSIEEPAIMPTRFEEQLGPNATPPMMAPMQTGAPVDSTDPMQAIYQSLNAIQQDAKAPMPQYTPRPKQGPIPSTPGTFGKQGGDGNMWRTLLEKMGPMLGAFAHGNPSARAGFMEGYSGGQQRAQAEKAKQAQLQEMQRKTGADYSLDILDRLNKLDDPTQFDQLRDIATKHAPPGTDPQEFSRMEFPQSRMAAKRLKEVDEEVAKLEKAGYDLDKLAESGGAIKMKDGTSVPLRVALQLTRARPTDQQGKPIAAPKKEDFNPTSDLGKYLADAAYKRGKTVRELSEEERDGLIAKFRTLNTDPIDAENKRTLTELTIERAQKALGQEEDPNIKLLRQLAVDAKQKEATEGKPKKPSSGNEKRNLGFFVRAKQATEDIQNVEEEIAGLGLAGQARLKYGGNLLQTQTGQSYIQAQRSFTEARLRKDSGAAIPTQEYDNDARTYFAQPGDSQETMEQKRRARRAILSSLATESGRALDEHFGEDADGIRAELRAAQAKARATERKPVAPGMMRARDPQGKLHEAPIGTPLPSGWKAE